VFFGKTPKKNGSGQKNQEKNGFGAKKLRTKKENSFKHVAWAKKPWKNEILQKNLKNMLARGNKQLENNGRRKGDKKHEKLFKKTVHR
jgi:hypothetical protein